MCGSSQHSVTGLVAVQECKVFEEVLSVQCPSSRLRIRLKGAGIAPAIQVSSYHPTLACFTLYPFLHPAAWHHVLP